MRDATPQFNPELTVQKQRAAQRYDSPKAKAKPPEKKVQPAKPKRYNYKAGDLVQENTTRRNTTIQVQGGDQPNAPGLARTPEVKTRQKRTFKQQVANETKEMKLRAEEVELRRKQLRDQMSGRSC